MPNILFLDTEIDPKRHKILDLGGIRDNGSTFHSKRIEEFILFIGSTKFLCGHNLFNHDLKFLLKAFQESGLNNLKFIDTLFLSPLLFPAKPYHRLLKDDKLQTESLNNPLNDAIKAKDLFFDELTTFNLLPESVKQIYFLLLHDQKEFQAFFGFYE